MKRSGRLNPGKGFKPRSSPMRRGRLVRNAEVSRKAEVASQRPKQTAEERQGRRLLKARSGGICEMDGRNWATDAHHRKNRSQGGTWDIVNLLHLCREHHQFVTVSVAIAVERGWGVRSFQDPTVMPVWIAGRGWTLLTADGGYESTERSAA